MTYDELMALPDVTPKLQPVVFPRTDGTTVAIPVMNENAASPLWQGPDDGAVTDMHGVQWMVGWLHGVRVRRRMHS